MRREDKLADLRGKKIGFIFQMFNLVPTLTALENVMLPVIFQGKNSEMEGKAIELLDKMGLKERMNHLPRQLSGGEQQRIVIARAIITKPMLLLTDEPTGNLDPENAMSIMKIFRDINEKGTTVLIATHNEELYRGTGRRVLNINNKYIDKESIG